MNYNLLMFFYVMLMLVLLFFAAKVEATPTYRFCHDMGAYILCVDWNGNQVQIPKRIG